MDTKASAPELRGILGLSLGTLVLLTLGAIICTCHFSRDRRHWVLWIEWDDEYGKEAQVRSYMRKDSRGLEEIAEELVKVAYQSEEKESDELGRPDEASSGLLTDKDWQRLLQELWP